MASGVAGVTGGIAGDTMTPALYLPPGRWADRRAMALTGPSRLGGIAVPAWRLAVGPCLRCATLNRLFGRPAATARADAGRRGCAGAGSHAYRSIP